MKIVQKLKKLNVRQKFFIATFGLIGLVLVVNSFAAGFSVSIEPEQFSSTGCVTKLTDATSSNGGAVQFGAAGGSCTLDHSGKTIPSTNYAIPAGAIYMSPTGIDKTSSSVDGNDTNNGLSVTTPVKTINRALALVPSGGTIVMRGGEYRDWNAVNGVIVDQGKSFTLQAYPNESPWLNGADIVNTGWASAGTNVWSRTWETPEFCGGQYYTAVGGKTPFDPTLTVNTPCVYWDAVRSNTNVAGDPQNVFINDTKLTQVPTLAQVTVNTFYYDWFARKMYIGQNPSTTKVELTRRPMALMLNKGQYALKGVGIKRYGSHQFPEGANYRAAVAVRINSPISAVIENSVFADNSGGTLAFDFPKDSSKVTGSVFAKNGYTGMGSNGFGYGGGRNDLLFENNVFNANNDENFDVNCAGACGASNVKFANMNGFIARNNVFENAKGKAYGFWCDVNCIDGVMVNNLVQNNSARGIFYEISSRGIIASNLVVNNGEMGISVFSATTKVYNNTVIFNNATKPLAQGIDVVDDKRCTTCQNDTGIGPDTTGVELVNNITVAIAKGRMMLSIYDGTGGTNTKTSQFYTKFDNNAYHRISSTELMYLWKNDDGTLSDIKSSAAFALKTGWDKNAIDISGSTDPFFVNRATGDYRVRTDSPAYNSGQPLPADVAAAIGVQSGVAISRGAIKWSNL